MFGHLINTASSYLFSQNNNQHSYKSKEDIAKEIKSMTFEEEINNDKKVFYNFFENQKNTAKSSLEYAGVDVIKRVISVIGSGKMSVIGEDGTKINASKNKLPAVSYLSHGARILVEAPSDKGQELFNWITSGDIKVDGTSEEKTQDMAIIQGKHIHNRYAATHGIELKNNLIKETKGFLIGAKDYAYSKGAEILNYSLGKYFNQVTNHYGMDLYLGIEGERNKEGKIVKHADGEHGHLYFYKKLLPNQKMGLLIGIEGASPDSSHHSKTGAPDLYSPSYGSNWNDFVKKEKGTKYDGTIVPQKYNGRYIDLSNSIINKLVNVKASNLDNKKLSEAEPQLSISTFLDATKKDDIYESTLNTHNTNTALLSDSWNLMKSINTNTVEDLLGSFEGNFLNELE